MMSMRLRAALLGGVVLMLVGTAAGQEAASEIPANSPVKAALEKAEAGLAEITASAVENRSFETTFGKLDDVLSTMSTETAFVQFMAHVSTSAAERETGLQAEQDVGNWTVGLTKRADLYEVLKGFAETKPKLTPEQQKMVTETLRDFRRGGMNLPAEQRQKLKELQQELNKLGIEFDEAIRDDETRVPLTKAELSGMPEEFFAGLKETAGIYLVGMDYPTFIPIMDLCDNETTRKKVWFAYKRRGGERNVRQLEKILKVRAEIAKLLGYAHPADYEIEPRMARDAKTVLAFYEKLRPLVRKKAALDFAEFQDAKRTHTKDPAAVLQPWDYSFYEKYLQRTKYADDGEKVKEYFPVERVIEGLFSITQSLYGLKYQDITAEAASRGLPLWHEDVKLFEVRDQASGQEIGKFYIDLYPRDNKYNHAAQWGLAQHRILSNGDVERPLAALVCNFPKPTPDKPALLPHDDVVTFFHEFGHCLHTILSTCRYGTQSGTSVARDFVEAPSQMFENWVWDADVLNTFAGHYQTGEKLPAEMLKGMLAAKHLGSGMAAERQFFYGLFDLKCHVDPEGDVRTIELADTLFPQVEMFAPVKETYFHASFGHLVGYEAGYYGYQWSLVYAADMFERFKELGMLNPEAGKYYRDKILSRGGTLDEMDMIRDYLGREPRMEPYLELLGLETK